MPKKMIFLSAVWCVHGADLHTHSYFSQKKKKKKLLQFTLALAVYWLFTGCFHARQLTISLNQVKLLYAFLFTR